MFSFLFHVPFTTLEPYLKTCTCARAQVKRKFKEKSRHFPNPLAVFLAGAPGRFHPVPHRQRRLLSFLAQVRGPVWAVLVPREVGGGSLFFSHKKGFPPSHFLGSEHRVKESPLSHLHCLLQVDSLLQFGVVGSIGRTWPSRH